MDARNSLSNGIFRKPFIPHPTCILQQFNLVVLIGRNNRTFAVRKSKWMKGGMRIVNESVVVGVECL